MDATQAISDSFLESDEEENEEENPNKRGQPLAKLCILKNAHIPEAEFPLFLGDNVLGRDPTTCTLPLPASSVSKQHATICISDYRRRGHSEADLEALVWDLGSLNGTRKGRLKLTPNVRYALSEGDSLVVADIPCQYVSCGADSSQGDTRTPVSRNVGVKAGLLDASGEKGGDTSTSSEKSVNGGTKATVSLKKTPVRASCLSFEQTPTQPQGTLVPESDSDSESERGGVGERRHKALVSDSDSHKSSPTCSTFLSPTNKIVPESEDESPITPSSSSKNKPSRHVSFSTEEIDVDVRRQQLNKKNSLAIVGDSEEEEGKEEERAAQGGTKSKESGQHVPVKQESSVSLTGEDELPVSTSAVSTDMIPVFAMDSDTDMEGEEEGVAPEGPVTLNTKQVDQSPNTVQIHMDSDTDVDDDADVLGKVPKTLLSSEENTKPPPVISVIQPEGVTMDSDTDVEDDDEDAAVSNAATKAKPTSFQTANTDDPVSSMQPKHFHLDSDTDVDEEEEEGEHVTKNKTSKTDETPNKLDVKLTVPESAPAAPHSLNLDSDTDDEAVSVPAISEPSVVAAVTASCTVADAGADLDILSDSDTDVEDNSPQVLPVAVATLSASTGTASKALQSDSDADTDVDESSVSPAGNRANPADLNVDSNTDVEDKEADIEEAGEDQIPSLQRENTPGLLVPLLQNCSTPVQLPEGEVENMETQAFTSPSLGAFRSPTVRPGVLPSCSDSQEDEAFVVAETQSFIVQTPDRQGKVDPTKTFVLESPGDKKDDQSSRGESFQLGLSDSSHLQCQDQALAMGSTQAFVSVEGGVNLEDTQAYAAVSSADRASADNDLNLEATQAYGDDEEPARCSAVTEKGQVDLALEATQAYISEPCSDPEDDTDEDERQNNATTETQLFDFPTASTLAMAETQLVPPFVDEESLAADTPVSSVHQVKLRTQNETKEREEHQKAAQPQAQSLAATQPMCTSDHEESDDEDSFPGPQKRKAKPLQSEEEQTQPLTGSVASLAETQPMAICEDEESDDSMPGPRKRKAKQLHLEEEETQTLTNSEISADGTQPIVAGEDDESDGVDSMPGPQKRKAKQLHLEEEETQALTSSEVCADATQPIATHEDDESDDADSMPGPRKRKAKQLHLEEEETQTLTNSELSADGTLPITTCEDDESEGADSMPGLRKRKAKPLQFEEETQPLAGSEVSAACEGEQSEEEDKILCPQKRKEKPLQLEEQTEPLSSTDVSAVECQPLVTGEDEESDEEESIPLPRKRKAKQLHLEEEETQTLTNSEISPVKTQPLKTKTGQELRVGSSETGTSRSSRRTLRDTSARLREEKEQPECPIPPKRQTRGENKTLPKTRGKRGKARPDDENSEEEEKQPKRARGKKITRQQKDENADDEKLEIEKHTVNKSLIDVKEGKDAAQLGQQEREKTEEEMEKINERERQQKEEVERQHRREEEEKLENERKAKEEQEKLQAQNAERMRLELERAEKERIERERIEQAEKAKRELEERLEKERKEQEQAQREREAKEREEKEKLEKEKEAKEKQLKHQQENREEENEPKVSARGRRASRRTTAASTELRQESNTSTNDDVPARRTRSRSNSSNSVSSERSASSANTQESKGRGRGRGAKRTSETPQTAVVRGSRRRTTTDLDSKDICPQGPLSKSNSSNSSNTEISSCGMSSQNKEKGGQQRGRGRKTESASDSISPVISQSEQISSPKPTPRGKRSRKTQGSSTEVPQENNKEKADSQKGSATRGRQQTNAKGSEPAATDEEDQSNQEEGRASEEAPLPKRNVRGRGPKAVKSETAEGPAAPTVSDSDETKDKRKGRKSELEDNTRGESSRSTNISKSKDKSQKTEAAETDDKDETQDEIPAAVQVRRGGRASSTQSKKSTKEVEVKEKMEVETVEQRVRGRASVIPKKKTEELEGSGTSVTSMNQQATVERPQTPSSSVSRKRQAPAEHLTVAKSPRSSSVSPTASGRVRAASQAYKVLFTGVVDEAGERVLAHLGGSMAKGVADMNCLVTDKVRRTVKFLCALAKGVPIVTTDWLEKSGKAGSFLSPNGFIVKDQEQENKFNFCLQESLRMASMQPLLQGYEIHVTKSVKPEPVHMKDIISSCGASFLPKMPSSHKPQTVVISCEEDRLLCGPAVSASLPVVTAEFILTGILQQKLDFQTHTLPLPASNLQPAGGRGRGRRKT